jgi:ABC-type microcin C transport system permease subunit YejB
MALVLALPVMAIPYAGYLYPAGVKAGSTVRVLIGGQNLGGITGGIISGKGVRVVRAVVVLGALLYQFVNLVTDLAYAALDPRVRFQKG